MPRRVPLCRAASLATLLAVLLLGQAGAAQTLVPVADYPAEVSEMLRRGRQLEMERRWGDALSHYEDAVRRFPDDRGLQLRFDNARAHYDVGRRYGDRSFGQLLGRLTLRESLDLYGEVLLKIQAHYVEAPHWKELVERGTNLLEVALSEPSFLRQNAPKADQAALENFRYELRRTIGPRVIGSRGEAVDAAAAAALLAQRRLGIGPPAVVLEYMCGASNALDLYSTFLTPDQLTEVYSQIKGNFVGLGVELKASDGALWIVRVIRGSPAEQAGIRAGDRIVSVDGRPTEELSTDQAANLLQGEAGSVARLTVVSPGREPRQVSVRREHVEVPSIDGVTMLRPELGIGYFKLTCFQETTCRDLDAALWDLHRQGMRSLIIDLRGNPGGLLLSAVEVADRFLDQGTIVSTRGRSPQEDFTYSAHATGTWRVPLVLVIDHDSASAAEIFAGAIGYYRRGTVVGTRSYGKGSVQSIFQLPFAHGGLRLTTSKFYSPGGQPYNHLGVEPDILIQQAARPIDESGQLLASGDDDPMLAAAIQAAQQLVAQR